jgi:hypothetical protein
MSGDLYQMPSSGAKFTSFCGGNLQSENESCLEFAPIPGSGSAFIIRDTKAPGASTARSTCAVPVLPRTMSRRARS